MADFKLVGAVAIKVRPDASKFRGELQRDLTKELAGFEKEIKVTAKVKADTTEMKTDVEEAKKEAERKKMTLKVGLDYASVKKAQAQLEAAVKGLEAQKIEVELDEDGIERARGELEALKHGAEIEMTFVDDEKGYKAVLAKIAEIRRQKLEETIHFGWSEEELAAKEAEMKAALQDSLTMQIHYGNDRASIERMLAQVNGELDKLKEITFESKLDKKSLKTSRKILEDALARTPVELKVNYNDQDSLKAVRDRLKTMLSEVGSEPLKVKFNEEDLQKELDRINGMIDEDLATAVKLDDLTVMFKPDEKGWREVLARIEQIQRTRLEVPIDLDLSDDELAAKKAEIEGTLDDLSRPREVRIRIAEADRVKVEKQARDLKDYIDGLKGTMQVELAGTLAVGARLALLGRDRIVTYFATVNARSIALVEGTLKSLAGLNVLHEATARLERLFTSFDTIALKVGTVSTLIGNLANVALYATSSLFAVGDGVVKSLGLLALGPTILGSLFTTLLIGQAVFKDFGAAAHGIEAALKRLPPAGQAAAKMFQKVFAEVRENISQEFWGKASDSMLRFAQHTLPVFSRGLSGVAAQLGSVFGGILDSFTNLSLAGGLDKMFANLIQMFKNLSAGATAFWDALNIIGLRGSEFLPQFGTWLTKIATQFRDWADASSRNGDLTRWIQQGVVSLKEMWKVGGDVIDIFKAIASAALGAGAGGLGSFQLHLREIADEMNSASWQNKASDLFRGGREGAAELNAGFQDLKHSIGESSAEFANMLRLFGSIGGGLLSNIGLVLGNQKFQDGATASLEGLQKMLDNLRPGALALAGILGNVDRVAGVAFSHLGTLLTRMLTLVDTAFSKIADGLMAVTPRLMNTVGSLFLAATPAVIAMAEALKTVLDIINLVPGGFVAAGAAATVFFALRALGSKFFDKFQATNYFKALQSGWAQQQIAAGKTVDTYKQVDGVFRKFSVPAEKFRATSAVFRDLTSTAGQTVGSLRAMYAIAAQTPQRLGPMTAAVATARNTFVNWGTALAPTARQLGSFYSSLRVGSSTINPQNEALLRNRAAALGIIGPQREMATQFRTSAGAIKDATSAWRLMTPAMNGLRPAFSQVATASRTTAGQVRTMYGMFQTAPARLGPFTTAMRVASTAVGATSKAVGGGLLSLLGGPWGIAFLAAGGVVAAFAQAQADAKAKVDAFTTTLDKQTGAVTAASTAMIAANIVANRHDGFLDFSGIKSSSEVLKAMKLSIEDVADVIAKGGPEYDRLLRFFKEGEAAAALNTSAIGENGVALGDGGVAWEAWTTKVGIAKDKISGMDLTAWIGQMEAERAGIQGSVDIHGLLNDSLDKGKVRTDNFNDAMRRFNDTTRTGDDRVRALNDAIRILNGTPLDLEDAKAAVNADIRRATGDWQKFSETVNGKTVESLKLVGGAFRDAEGKVRDFTNVINPMTGEIDTVGEAGANLRDILGPIAEDTKKVATEMKTAKKPIGEISQYLSDQRANFVKLGVDAGLNGELVGKAYDHMIGANPKELLTLIKAEGVEEAETKLKNYKGDLDEVDAYRAVAEIAGDDKVLGVKLADSYTNLSAWDHAVGTATADLDPKKADAVRKRLLLDLFNLARTNPTVRANMDPRLLDEVLADANRDLDELQRRKPSPIVSAQIEEAKQRIQTIMNMMWEANRARATAIISVQTVYTTKGKPMQPGTVVRPGQVLPVANGGIISGAGRMLKHYANGGIENHVAQIQRAGGPVRIWAEPETYAEAYIPYAMSKRPRSVSILSRVAKDFGYTLNKTERYANGGVAGPNAVPTSTTSTSVTVGTINTVDPEAAIQKLRTMQRDALAVAGII